METIESDKTAQERGSIRLFDEKGTELYAGQADRIRGRGNSTWGLQKKPFQFKLREEADLFGFGVSKTWNLLANGYDETKLRNRIALGLAAELGMENVPQGQMLDLYMNGIYYGNYYLTEKISVEEERIAIRDMESELAKAYDTNRLEELTRFSTEDGSRKWTAAEYHSADITGGYLFERELAERYEEEISGFSTRQGDYYVLKNPAYASKEQVDYIAERMQEFQDAVEKEDGIHPVTGKHYTEYIDVTSFVQKYLVEEICKNYDGGVTSSFFYKPEDAVSTKIFAGPVWDYDVAFGNCNLDEIVSNPLGLTRLNNHVYATELFAQLYEKEDFYRQVVLLYEEKALPYLNWLVEEGIDKMAAESRDSVKLDGLRWEVSDNRYQYYKEYDNNVRYLKYFIETRKNFLTDVWSYGEGYHNIFFLVDGDAWQIDCVKDGELPKEAPIPFKEGAQFAGWVTENNVPFAPFKPIYEDLEFHALWQE